MRAERWRTKGRRQYARGFPRGAGAGGRVRALFEQFAQQLQTQGLLAQEGKLGDASFVAVPRQRNPCVENATIQAGGGPEAWVEQPAKQQQKDVDACWTKTNAEGITVTGTL